MRCSVLMQTLNLPVHTLDPKTMLKVLYFDAFNALKVVCNEMEGGWDTCLFNPYWYGTHVIVVGLNFNGDVVF